MFQMGPYMSWLLAPEQTNSIQKAKYKYKNHFDEESAQKAIVDSTFEINSSAIKGNWKYALKLWEN